MFPEILAQQTEKLQNVYTPLPLYVHLTFCIIATVLYLVQFYRKKTFHYVFLMIAVDLTFLTQYITSSAFITTLGVLEVGLLIAAGVTSFKYSKEQKRLNAQKIAFAEAEEQKAKEAQKKQEDKNSKFVDNAFDDK